MADFAAFRRTVQNLRSLPVVAPPAELSARLARALDAETAPRRRGIALWQPLTAGLSMAACLALVLWVVVLQPAGPGLELPGASVAYQAPTAAPTAPAATPTPVASSPAPSAPPPHLARRSGARFERAALPPARPGRARAGEPPAFGGWGERIAQLPRPAGGATADNGTGKPVGTFAGPETDLTTKPLVRQTGPVELAFTPPAAKPVGELVAGELTVSGQAEAMITLRVTSGRGLRVTNAHGGGVVYEGPLRRGETLRVPLRLLAWQPGEHALRAQLESDVPGVAADLPIALTGFVGEMGKNGQAEVSLTFHETPARQALRELAAAAGARVVVHEGLEPQRVTLDFSAGVPFAAALRILCDECGYRIQERDGVYHIVR